MAQHGVVEAGEQQVAQQRRQRATLARPDDRSYDPIAHRLGPGQQAADEVEDPRLVDPAAKLVEEKVTPEAVEAVPEV